MHTSSITLCTAGLAPTPGVTPAAVVVVLWEATLDTAGCGGWCAQVTSNKALCSRHHQADRSIRQTHMLTATVFHVQSLQECSREDWRCWPGIPLSTEPAHPQADKHTPGATCHTRNHFRPRLPLSCCYFSQEGNKIKVFLSLRKDPCDQYTFRE